MMQQDEVHFAHSTTSRSTIAWNSVAQDSSARLGRDYQMYGVTGTRGMGWFDGGFGKARSAISHRTAVTQDSSARLGRDYQMYGVTRAKDMGWFNGGFGKMVVTTTC